MIFQSARRSLRQFDYLLFGVVMALVMIGIVFITSATTTRGEWGETMPSRVDFAGRQLQWLLISLGVFFAILVPKYTRLRGFAFPFYALMLVLLVVTLKYGTGPERSPVRRWLVIGDRHNPIAYFQASQIMQVALVVALARYLMFRHCPRLHETVIVFMLSFVPMGLILVEPDLGTAMLFLPVPFMMLLVSGASWKRLLGIAGAGVAAVPVFWLTRMEDYQKMRLLSWLAPDQYKNAEGWHYITTRIAVGSGGVLGSGVGNGAQKYFIPENHTDMIFSVICEEGGFLGALILIGLYLTVILCGLGIAARTREPFGRLIVVGVVTFFGAQVFVNMGMNVGLLPITGLTLPLVSYGGSSLLASFVAIGIMMNVAVHPVVDLGRDTF